MWFLNLPDILVFFAIWWAGFLTCFALIILFIFFSVWEGGSITFGCAKKESKDDKLNF